MREIRLEPERLSSIGFGDIGGEAIDKGSKPYLTTSSNRRRIFGICKITGTSSKQFIDCR